MPGGRFHERVQALSERQRARLSTRLQALRDRQRNALVAYVVAHPGHQIDRDALVRFLREELPDYMVPSIIVPLEALPKTTAGKVDRRALPEPWPTQSASTSQPPDGPLEQALARVWRDVLGLTHVGRDDDFFADLGGHSLLATRLLGAVREALGVDLPLRALFECPTIAGLARLVDAQQASGELPAAPPIRRLPRSAHRTALDAVDEDA